MEAGYTVHQKQIKLDAQNTITNLWVFGDVHRDSSACDSKRWKWFLEKAAKDDPKNTYYMGLGDYNDYASWSEQKAIKGSNLHDQTIRKFDNMVINDVDFIASEMAQMKGRTLGLIEGNHTWEFTDGTTATQMLCAKMETIYLGWLTHYTLTFKVKNRPSTNVYIVACHGKAGGKRIGASINQVEDMKTIFPAADIYIMGHNHDRGAWPVDVLLPSLGRDGVVIKQKRQFLCRSGSFLKAYEKDKSSYVVSRLLRPSDLGALKLEIGFHRDTSGTDRIITDIHAII